MCISYAKSRREHILVLHCALLIDQVAIPRGLRFWRVILANEKAKRKQNWVKFEMRNWFAANAKKGRGL